MKWIPCSIAPRPCSAWRAAALQDDELPPKEGFRRFIRHEPLGIVLDIPAWNYPLLIAVNVVIPALLAGNAVLIKHARLTPLCGDAFVDAFRQDQLPARTWSRPFTWATRPSAA